MKDKLVCKICRSKTELFYDYLYDERYGYPGNFSLFRCLNCQTLHTEPSIDEREIANLYTKYYPRKTISPELVAKKGNRFCNSIFCRAWRYFKGETNVCHYYVAPRQKVMDIACGDGCSLIEINKIGAIPHGTEADGNVQKVAKVLKLN